ncbi:C-type lectin domain family 4 member F-like isoform X2 [Motacilla alba alba]|nr:C-type lectin domain family 4 member F-like isoform X2 [Motacilla alba alba]XP_037982163.1 C-type lectin domain family 4 member F-like isoform X2 [Motacilla alba alba]
MMNEGLQELNNKIKALHENFKKLEESTKNELQIIRAELEKNQGEKENEIARGLESVLNKHLLQLSQRIQTLEEDLQKWPETTKNELQIIRGYLENQGEKENEIARGLESVLNKHLLQLSQRIQTLEEDVQKWPETTKHELQIIRGYLENQEKKKEERSRALETELQQLSQRIQTLEEDLQKWPETTKHELQIIRGYLENQEKKKEERSRALETELQQLSPTIQALGQLFRQDFPYHVFLPFRAYLENNQGIAMQQEEIIHLRVPELAGGERINIWTDSRRAFGIGPAQGAVWNRRLREIRGFSRSVSGGEVEWITPGASENLHANQDQRTACLDSLFRSIEGIQRSLDIRASRTNDLQVLMLTLGVLISIIILARIFTFPWP